MKNVLLVMLIVSFSGYSSAQIGGINGLKNKAKSAKSKVKSKTGTTGVSNSSGSGVDAKKIATTQKMEGEAQEFIDVLSGYFSGDNIKNIATETIEGTMYDLKSKLSTIKNYYAETSMKLSSLEADYTTYKELAETEYKNRDIADENAKELKYLNNSATYFREKGDANSTSSMIEYAKYVKWKDAYNAQVNKDVVAEKYIADLEDYFDNYLPNEFSQKLKEYYSNQQYFKEDYWRDEPQRAIERIEYVLENKSVEAYKTFSRHGSWIDDVNKMLVDHKAKLVDYKDNGEYAAYKEKKRREKADKVFPSKSAMNDASIISVVKKKHNVTNSGTIKKIIITSDWYVKKNDFGLPIEKSVEVEVITTMDGECYLNRGSVFRTYEGGGTYGAKKLSFYRSSSLMNCKNM
ncbi:MAG: hypothetical protein AB8B56_08685 [Crocinitomicaceae bacterium]